MEAAVRRQDSEAGLVAFPLAKGHNGCGMDPVFFAKGEGRSDKSIRKGIRSKQRRIKEHQRKLEEEPESLASRYWQKQIDEWERQIAEDERRLEPG